MFFIADISVIGISVNLLIGAPLILIVRGVANRTCVYDFVCVCMQCSPCYPDVISIVCSYQVIIMIRWLNNSANTKEVCISCCTSHDVDPSLVGLCIHC